MLDLMTSSFPQETIILGRLLAGYPELEFSLLSCIESVTGEVDAPIKLMFRTRGETQRIEIADAFARQKFNTIGIGTQFEMAIGAMHHCRKIRNQYSHCHWLAIKTLAFVDLEDVAKQHTPVTRTTPFPSQGITRELLKQQEEFFDYTGELLFWLDQEALFRRGEIPKNDYQKPKQVARPPLCTP